MEVKKFTIFPTLVMGFDLTGEYDPEVIIGDYAHKDHRLVEDKSGESGSTYAITYNYLFNNDKFRPLVEQMHTAITLYAQEMNLLPLKMTNSWLNLGKKGSNIMLHRHEASVISGAFYPKVVGEDSAALILHSPIKATRMYDVFSEPNELNDYYHHLPAKQGMLYLFPSWAEHETKVSNADERWCISFNTDYIRDHFNPNSGLR
tara:strand:- start:313 stop:924 length:612 start_codon:yes stop_codon:yes gene_type:complete